MKILVTGSIAYDLLLSYDGSFPEAIKGGDLDQLSVSFFMPHFAKHHGGTAANIGWNLKLLNQDPLIAGTVGNDGGAYTALLSERGIDVSRIEMLQDHVTATAIIGTDDAEHQIAFFHPGADAHGTWPDLSDDRDDLACAIVSARNPVLMREAGRWCAASHVPWIYDPGQQVIFLPTDELRVAVEQSNGVVVNGFEWGVLSEKIGVSVDSFLKINPLLIVTNGEQGVTVHARDGTTILPACKANQVVNPTGAGDAFRAGLLTGISARWPVTKAAQLGAAIGSFVVEQEGTLLDHLDLNDLLGRAEVTYGEPLPALP